MSGPNWHTVPDFNYFVYAMLCRDGDGPLYVKFGHSRRIGARLTELRTSCPIPARYFATIECPTAYKMKQVELELHRHFKDRRTTGEWFKFDPDSEQDKRDFNDGCTLVFLANLGSGFQWEKISVKQLDARKQYYRNLYGHQKAFRDRCKQADARKQAWKELS